MQKEIEAKFIGIDKVYVRERLSALGFKLKKHETLMRRKAFHFANDVEQGRKRWARVRDEGDKIVMTVKEILKENDIDSVLESEVVIDSFEQGAFLLKALGMGETAYQENYREIWTVYDNESKSEVEVVIDSWPHIKPYIEIEGKDTEVVSRCANLLGYDMKNALYGAVDTVYEAEHGIPRDNINRASVITFETPFKSLL